MDTLVKATQNVRRNVIQRDLDLALEMRVHAVHVLLHKVVHFGAKLDTCGAATDYGDVQECSTLFGCNVGEGRLF
jgi:hypothetical protein